MSTITKNDLSGSTDGLPILIAAVATLGNTIHTAVNSTDTGTWDEIWIYATNSSDTAAELFLEWGTVTASLNKRVIIPSREGELIIIPGFVLQNAKVVTAFAGTTNVLSITGFVNSIVA